MKKPSKKSSTKLGLLQKIKQEIAKNRLIYLLLLGILILGLFFRVYRTGQILGFYFDQGRDAMEVWELIHHGDFFLIGPTTGIAGIFRGPFYYYLITPFYAISRGDPVLPANFLSFTTILASAILFYLATKSQNKAAGIMAVFISALSFYLVMDSRWLSNPTPMFLLSMLMVLSMFKISEGKRWYWALLSFISGLSLFHFGSSGEFFYFPAILVFAIWQRKHFPNLKILIASIMLFSFTVFPLVLFDFKNNHLLSNNIRTFLLEKESFQTDFWVVAKERIVFYSNTFFREIFPTFTTHTNIMLVAFGISFLVFIPSIIKNTKIKIVILMLLSPVVGLLFFQGNEGNIYGYYLTGYYLMFVLLFGIIAGKLWESTPGKILVGIFLIMFVQSNLPPLWTRINDEADKPTTIVLKNQKQALNWIYNDANRSDFNFDVYVPPVIPYAYDYLFTWYENKPEYNGLTEDRIELLYTLYEVDPPHPERLKAWQERQDGIGKVIKEQKFGGITVQRRSRIKYTN